MTNHNKAVDSGCNANTVGEIHPTGNTDFPEGPWKEFQRIYYNISDSQVVMKLLRLVIGALSKELLRLRQ